MEILKCKRIMSEQEAEKLKGSFLSEKNITRLVTDDADGYDMNGNLLFRFRKNRIPVELARSGYEAFKGSIQATEGRGMAAGKPFKRESKDGTISNTTVSNFVDSGNVGFMDPSAMVHYCRKTAFAREYFDKFKEGIPFVEHIDKLYEELCPEHYAKQKAIARGTNRNYVIADTSFTTVTVNRNFQTAVHKDAGDFPKGFGNLIVYREGSYKGAYFCMPEFGVGIDMQNGDVLFADVHRWHGNTPFVEPSEDYLRIAFVMYYREYMYKCKQPAEELAHIKQKEHGFLKL